MMSDKAPQAAPILFLFCAHRMASCYGRYKSSHIRMKGRPVVSWESNVSAGFVCRISSCSYVLVAYVGMWCV